MVKMIYRVLVLGPFATNCYIVGSTTTGAGMVIDPASEPNRILDNVRDLGIKLSLVVITHAHIDHIGAIGPVIEATGASFAAPAAEVAMLQGYQQRSYYLPGFAPPPLPDKLLHDGDFIDIGDMKFQILATPGHSPGGISILGSGLVFTGDALFNMGIGRTDLHGANYRQLISSIRDKLLGLPDKTLVLPGHGPKTTIGNERLHNPFLSQTVP